MKYKNQADAHASSILAELKWENLWDYSDRVCIKKIVESGGASNLCNVKYDKKKRNRWNSDVRSEKIDICIGDAVWQNGIIRKSALLNIRSTADFSITYMKNV